jgi:transcriptional regulator with XRE-family HTH domain
MPPMDIAALFGENLARCRRRADMSQEDLGVRASLHRTEISQLERGLRVSTPWSSSPVRSASLQAN